MDITQVIKRAGEIQMKANEALSAIDKKEQIKYSKMIEYPEDKIYLMRLMDESTQITNKSKLVKRIRHLDSIYGELHFLSSWEKLLFRMFVNFGQLAPAISVPMFQSYLRSTTSKVIINEAPRRLNKHLAERGKEQIGQNVNLIGEVVLGEGEALKRYHHYLEALEKPEIGYMSIKVSGIYSQLHPLNYEQSKSVLIERLSTLYRKAIEFPVKDIDGNISPKFINMDMEEYKDMDLTYDVFTETLDKDEFKNLYAGLVIQAYLPDSAKLQRRLIEWSKARVKRGGAAIKMRLVKGANLQMETVVSSAKHWEVPVYDTKVETDANYLRMIDYGFQPENIKAVHMGIASHNLFSIAYAQTAADVHGVKEYVSFEMLEGMANNLVVAMHRFGFNLVLYTPVVTNENFLNAVSYLVRRLDENTGEENFIAHSFNLEVDDKSWKYLLTQFNDAISMKDTLSDAAKRKQDRINETYEGKSTADEYTAEPDTDFDLQINYEWSKNIISKWKFNANSEPIIFPIQVGAKSTDTGAERSYIDHSQQDADVEIFKVKQASPEQVEEIIQIADNDPSGWRSMGADQRHKIFADVATVIRENRADLIGIMCAVTGKTIMEGDVEVSEAIDFIEYYPRSAKEFASIDGLRLSGKGTVLVIPPWNFPLAIPVGGVIAGLAAGNTVIIKPATVSAPVAYHFVQLMHQAGIPKEALQIVLPAERASLNELTKHEAIKHIILTGGTETAYRILENNPKVPLSAETGGKNAMIVTSSADKDLAVASAVQSAFGNAGQKCSACSLLLLQSDLYDDPQFMEKLKDATVSLQVGSPWDLTSEIGPMIDADTKNKELIHAIENLEAGESWMVKPEIKDKRRFLMSPGVKLGVKPESYTFKTELFAPLLSVVRFNTLEEAIDMVNSTGYGLTTGIHTLDEREQALWMDRIEAGNLYINRGITGAIVQRQPFGGMKESAFGNGIKAGGPNYVSCFMKIDEETPKYSNESISELGLSQKLQDEINKHADVKYIKAAVQNYRQSFDTIFSEPKDVSNIIGEDNHLRYIPALGVGVRVRESESMTNVLMIAAAIEITGTKVDISISDRHKQSALIGSILEGSMIETDESFFKRAKALKRLRICGGKVSDDMYNNVSKHGVFIADNQPVQNGRIELLNYLQEQSVTNVYHRYGNLGDREIK